MQRLRTLCIDHAAFLATLGALLLELGDAEAALVWLERSLMLNPDGLGARVDHALALSALGEPGALQELAVELRSRTDLPDALRTRLFPTETTSAFALPLVRLGHELKPQWGVQGEISLLAGHEGNLDRSPRLTELTLTLPDEIVVLPVESQRRAGAAAIAAAALELAYAPQPATVMRTGVVLAARAAPRQGATDWRQWQWIVSASHGNQDLRGSIDIGLAGVGGPLGEPYTLRRIGLNLDAHLQSCRLQLAAETEQRRQRQIGTLDAQINAATGRLQCPLPSSRHWHWQMDLRVLRDHPRSNDRPGGLQRGHSAGVRLSGPVWPEVVLEVGLHASRARDALGYSPLLENNAPRQFDLTQFTLELTTPIHLAQGQRLEAVLRWQDARQDSNLPLFRYRASSAYTGLRWLW